MADITLTVSDAVIERVLTALRARWQYPETIENPADPYELIPNPQPRAVFVKQQIARLVKREVVAYEAELAQRTVANTSETEITIE